MAKDGEQGRHQSSNCAACVYCLSSSPNVIWSIVAEMVTSGERPEAREDIICRAAPGSSQITSYLIVDVALAVVIVPTLSSSRTLAQPPWHRNNNDMSNQS